MFTNSGIKDSDLIALIHVAILIFVMCIIFVQCRHPFHLLHDEIRIKE